jgi:hypothetical protein
MFFPILVFLFGFGKWSRIFAGKSAFTPRNASPMEAFLGVRFRQLSTLEKPEPERFRLPQVFEKQRLIPYLRLLLIEGQRELHDDRVSSLTGFIRF